MNVRTIARATDTQRRRVQDLLAAAGLPLDGLDDATTTLFVAEEGDELAGCAAVERYDEVALLRSVATRPEQRGQGIAAALTEAALADAQRHGARTAYLLTTSAEGYFARHGFHPISRSLADPRLSQSKEWGEVCRTATLMYRTLVA